MEKASSQHTTPNYIVLIGASAGGLKAFKDFLAELEENDSYAYILLQHLDPSHKSMLPDLLQESSTLPVVEITEGLTLEAGKVYVLPSNAIPKLEQGIFSMKQKQPKIGSAHLIDDFFHDAAIQYPGKVMGVVLSGTGTDGTRGLEEIKKKQGITFAQDLNSAQWPGMPENAIEAGVVDFVLTISEIVKKIYEVGNLDVPIKEAPAQNENSEDKIFYQILKILEQQEGTDFSRYKKNTIVRRINRRQLLHGDKKLSSYLSYFKENKDEVAALYNDLLIPVTEFFRDRKTFDYLENEIFPKLLAGKGDDTVLRIWVAGCSTGQEAYSIAITLADYLKKAENENPYGETYLQMEDRIKIFATDLSSRAIAKARKGTYQKSEMEGVDQEHLDNYFVKTNYGYQIDKNLRRMCVFAEHDFLNDFPFGSMHLVSCRNVLIYLDAELQKKALTNFHYALSKKGVLLLGNSETIGPVPDLFNTIEKGHKLYRRNDDESKSISILGNKSSHKPPGVYKKKSDKSKQIQSKDFAEMALLEDFVPVAIVINEYLDLVKVYGKTGKYLEHTSGKASRNILKLAKGRLGFEIRRLVKKYNPDEDRILTKAGILLDSNGKKYRVSLHLRQLQEMSSAHYLVVFEEEEIELSPTSETEKSEEDSRIVLLEEEIMELRQELLDKVEEHQISEEELQSANEELMSGTEELQTLNEELETSKEELQSTVEEITVVNQELSTINGLLHREKNISESIIRTIRDPLLILNRNFEVIIANRSFYKNFNIDEVNTLGKSIYQLGNGQWDIPKLHTALESILPKKKVFSDYEVTHNFESIGKKTMVLNGQILKEDGSDEESIFLSIEDVTAERDALSKLKESINTHNEFVRSSPWPIAILKQEDLKVEIANKAMLKVWDKNKDILGKPLAEVVPELASTDIMGWLKEVYRTGVALESFQQKNRLKSSDGKPKYYDVIYQPQRSTDGEVIGVSIIATVVTQQVLLNEKVKESEKQYKELTNNLPEFIISYDIRKEKYYYNKSLLDFTGSTLESLARNNWYSILHPEDYERMMNIYGSAIENNENFEMEVRVRNKEGDYLWCLNRNHCIVDSNGNALRWIGTNTLIQRLKDEEKRKEDFLKLVSHELKTPVTSIKGYVQMILSMISEDPAKPINTLPIKSSLERVENQVTRLTHLIAEMLDLSRMKESKLDLKLESFDLCELVKETILDVQHSSGMVEIKSSFEDVCNVHADKDRIGQVLINFITNAIKYSPEQKDIHVSVYNDEPGYISVSVSDSGIGISDSDLSKIFDRFYRVSGKNEGTYAGFGIGLFLAKAIIDRHNGKIRVESKLNKGSNFIFSLPYEK